MRWAQIVVVVLCLATFWLVVGHHFKAPIKDAEQVVASVVRDQRKAAIRQSNLCSSPEDLVQIQGGHICRANAPTSPYRVIFHTYPAGSGGREEIYRDVSNGAVDQADKLLLDIFPIERYPDFESPDGIVWDEGLESDPNWLYLYFGFRPLRHLFAAFDLTLEPKYLEKLREIVLDFSENGAGLKRAWADAHAVGYRAMFLVKAWWQLRDYNLASYEESEALLRLIEAHADFLADPQNTDSLDNHGIDQSAALYLIASNFPELDTDHHWLDTAMDWLTRSIVGLVDDDGVLIENSPYQQFSVLEKYWQIYSYSVAYGPALGEPVGTKMTAMLRAASYMLAPDRSIPLLGASIERTVNNSGLYKELARAEPSLLYALSGGEEGKRPSERSVYFPASGLTVLRSGWSRGTADAYITLDLGRFRTNRSDFDAFTFTAFQGEQLIRDAGLYTYDPGDLRDYFHGTRGHNTVLVDGADQKTGDVDVGELTIMRDYSSISANHRLYPGVSHTRSMTLIQDKYLVIIDKLSSQTAHEYRQLFHLTVGASGAYDGSTLLVTKGGRDQFAIHQLETSGLQFELSIGKTDPIQGFCSDRYGELLECPTAEFIKRADDAVFVTLIELGAPDPTLTLAVSPGEVAIDGKAGKMVMRYTETTNAVGQAMIISTAANDDQVASEAADTKPSPAVAIIFDDGYRSILPAAELMHEHSLKGNVAVIADRVESASNGYLDLQTLRMLQDEYGWNMVNHSRHHARPESYYAGPIGIEELDADITSGARFLIEHGLNSAPNWYVYPFGSFDDSMKEIVGRYYRFARTTNRGGATFPFADPLAVESVPSDSVEAGDVRQFVQAADLVDRVAQIVSEGNSAIVGFHRIGSRESTPPGYDYKDFASFINFLVKNEIPVLTLSEFDAHNGVSQPDMRVNDMSTQIESQVDILNRPWLSWLKGLGL